jgi:hypothetical protein
VIGSEEKRRAKAPIYKAFKLHVTPKETKKYPNRVCFEITNVPILRVHVDFISANTEC